MKNYREKAAARYEEMLAVTQSDIPGSKDTVRRYYRSNLLPRLPEGRDSAILDLGCGSGLFLDFLAGEGYTDARGVDDCPSLARSCGDSGLEVEESDNVDYLERHPGRFECVVLNHVLEHYDKSEGLALLEAVRVSLRPGGRVIVVCPNMANPYTAGRGRYADLTHETGYTPESIRFMLRLAGFGEAEVHGIDIYCLSNPLANAAGKVAWAVLSLSMRLTYLLNGVRDAEVLTKNMLALAFYQPGPVDDDG